MSGAQRPETLNFGCRLNAHESAAMLRLASEAGHDARTVIVNTCAVTAEAVRQARQAIRHTARARPDARIVVTGCAAQTQPERFAHMPEVAHVLGNREKMLPESWAQLTDPTSERLMVGDIMAPGPMPAQRADVLETRARASLQVQNGCDHRCTFCIIPFGRGNSRSAPIAEAVAQLRRLVENGFREVVLTGVDLTAYGSDLPGTPRLGTLVRTLLREVPDLPRLRLSSIDSVEADAELLACLAEEERLMPHLHLSLQAGDDLILKRMKRRHSRAEAIAFCREVRHLRPDVVFGADIIAGFPTETEAMFQRSHDLVAECGITHLHVFPYSARPGTPAARMPPVAGPAIKERARALRAMGARMLAAHCAAEIGQRRKVLVEHGARGHTEGFTRVSLPAGLAVGTIASVLITASDGQTLQAAA